MSPRNKVRIRRCVACEPKAFLISRNVEKLGTEPAAQGADHYTGNGYLYTSLSQLLALKRCERFLPLADHAVRLAALFCG